MPLMNILRNPQSKIFGHWWKFVSENYMVTLHRCRFCKAKQWTTTKMGPDIKVVSFKMPKNE